MFEYRTNPVAVALFLMVMSLPNALAETICGKFVESNCSDIPATNSPCKDVVCVDGMCNASGARTVPNSRKYDKEVSGGPTVFAVVASEVSCTALQFCDTTSQCGPDNRCKAKTTTDDPNENGGYFKYDESDAPCRVAEAPVDTEPEIGDPEDPGAGGPGAGGPGSRDSELGDQP